MVSRDLPENSLGDELPVKVSAILMDELVVAVKKLKNGRASGVDNIPVEIWKCLLAGTSHRVAVWIIDLEWAVDF